MSAAALVVLGLAGPAVLAAARPAESPAGFYLGMLSSRARTLDVGLELKADGEALSGSYYYFPMGEPIALRGKVAPDGTVRLDEGPESGVTGRWSGRSSKGILTGTWTDAKGGRAWSFRLQRSEEASAFFEGPPQSVNAGSTGPLTYRAARVPGGAKFQDRLVPLVTSFGDRKVSAAVNAQLVSLARQAHCPEEPDDHEFEARVSFVGEDVFSVRVTESWMCGAPYPTNASDSSVTFDLRTGKAIGMEELFRSGAEGVDVLLFAPRYAQALAVSKTSTSDDWEIDQVDCLDRFREESPLHRGDVKFRFSADGLVVVEELAHVNAMCNDEITVPYAVLAAVAAPGGPLARLAAADTRRPLRYRIRNKAGADTFYSPPR